ncbi:PiggyBac transposable element-derived protein 4 [Nymphon striatum]|nr:PiggyBac transposable element-derived protein 4 [Nymphon striatum]
MICSNLYIKIKYLTNNKLNLIKRFQNNSFNFPAFVGGAVCQRSLMKAIKKEFDVDNIFIGYGCTETSPLATISDIILHLHLRTQPECWACDIPPGSSRSAHICPFSACPKKSIKKMYNTNQAFDHLMDLIDNEESGSDSSSGDDVDLESDIEAQDLIPALGSDDKQIDEWVLIGNNEHTPMIMDFSGPDPGLVWDPPEDVQPVQFLEQFFTPSVALGGVSLWQHLGFQTDADYARLMAAAGHSPGILQHYPAEMNLNIMKSFIGLILNIGLNRKSNMNSYWDTKNPTQSIPIFSTTFRRDTFKAILRCFHASDREAEPQRGTQGYDPCFKSSEEIAIDESIVGHKGNHQLRCYIRIKKHHQWGPKEYNLADSKIHYMYRTMFHVNGHRKSAFGQPYDVCEKLMMDASLHHKYHHLHVDNYYTSVALAEKFWEKKAYVTGTIQGDRKSLPLEIKAKSGTKGRTVEMKKGDLLGVSWDDRAQVRFLSTNASSGTTNVAVRHSRHGEHRKVPNVAIIYNGGMRGVDCNDQLVDQYASELKTNKLWRKVVFHLIDRCVTNSYIMYKHHNENPLEHHNFLVQVVEGLVGNYQEPKKRPGRKAIAQSRRLTERHFLEPISGKNRRDCGLCSNRETKGIRVSNECKDCDIGLCVPCFKIWHTERRPHAQPH